MSYSPASSCSVPFTHEVLMAFTQTLVHDASACDWQRLIATCFDTHRPADRTALDEDMQTIGVPSDVPSDTSASGRYFFAMMASDSAPSTSPSAAGGSSTNSIPQVFLDPPRIQTCPTAC
jgi:hypothetical protein